MNALMFIILPHSPIQNQKIIHMLVFFPTLKPPSTFSLPLLTMSSQLSRFGCPLYFWGNLYKSEHQMMSGFLLHHCRKQKIANDDIDGNAPVVFQSNRFSLII